MLPRTMLLPVLLVLILPRSAGAQEQERRDPLLAQFEGTWQGVCENDGRSFPCDVLCHWDLQGAYMVSAFTVWQDAKRAQVLFEEREFARAAGEDTHALYSFSSSGVTRWGTRRGKGAHWSGSVKDSDGLGETFTIDWNGQNAWTLTRLLQDEEGNVLKKMVFTLHRSVAKRPGGR